MNSTPAARGSQGAGFTQPSAHSFAQPCIDTNGRVKREGGGGPPLSLFAAAGETAAKQSQVRLSNQLLLSFPPFPVRHPGDDHGTG